MINSYRLLGDKVRLTTTQLILWETIVLDKSGSTVLKFEEDNQECTI